MHYMKEFVLSTYFSSLKGTLQAATRVGKDLHAGQVHNFNAGFSVNMRLYRTCQETIQRSWTGTISYIWLTFLKRYISSWQQDLRKLVAGSTQINKRISADGTAQTGKKIYAVFQQDLRRLKAELTQLRFILVDISKQIGTSFNASTSCNRRLYTACYEIIQRRRTGTKFYIG